MRIKSTEIVSNVIPEECMIVTGTEWNFNDKPTNWVKRTDKLETTHLDMEGFKTLISKADVGTIMFGGSAWNLQVDDLLKMMECVKSIDKKIAFQVPCSLEDFQFAIGVHVAKNDGDLYETMLGAIEKKEDYDFFQMLGMSTIDHFIDHDYYVIAGLGEPKHYFIEKDAGDEI